MKKLVFLVVFCTTAFFPFTSRAQILLRKAITTDIMHREAYGFKIRIPPSSTPGSIINCRLHDDKLLVSEFVASYEMVLKINHATGSIKNKNPTFIYLYLCAKDAKWYLVGYSFGYMPMKKDIEDTENPKISF